MDRRASIPRHNNFDLLRLAFAWMVVGVHSYELSHAAALKPLAEWLSSSVAVHGFFVISGFLIAASFEKSRSLRDFFVKRARRIYPAYAAVIAFCVFGGLCLTTLSPLDYFMSRQTWKYIAANLVFLNFLQPSLPGVFADNTLSAVNGALWSIRVEALLYCLVPMLCRLSRRWSPEIACGGIYAVCVTLSLLVPQELSGTVGFLVHKLRVELLAPLVCFVCGTWLYFRFHWVALLDRREQSLSFSLDTIHVRQAVAWRPLLWRSSILLFAGSILVCPWFVTPSIGLELLRPLCLAVIVIHAGCVWPCLGNWGRYGDFSYGTYIYHFPILQTLIAAGLFREHPFVGLALAAAMTSAAACLSWHLVEKRFLRKESHYVAATVQDVGQDDILTAHYAEIWKTELSLVEKDGNQEAPPVTRFVTDSLSLERQPVADQDSHETGSPSAHR